MSSPYNPEPVSLGSILLPQDAVDYVKAAAINPALQAIADGVAFVGARLHVAAFANDYVDSQTSTESFSSTTDIEIPLTISAALPAMSPGDILCVSARYQIFEDNITQLRTRLRLRSVYGGSGAVYQDIPGTYSEVSSNGTAGRRELITFGAIVIGEGAPDSRQISLWGRLTTSSITISSIRSVLVVALRGAQ